MIHNGKQYICVLEYTPVPTSITIHIHKQNIIHGGIYINIDIGIAIHNGKQQYMCAGINPSTYQYYDTY